MIPKMPSVYFFFDHPISVIVVFAVIVVTSVAIITVFYIVVSVVVAVAALHWRSPQILPLNSIDNAKNRLGMWNRKEKPDESRGREKQEKTDMKEASGERRGREKEAL